MKLSTWILVLSVAIHAQGAWASSGGGVKLREARIDISDTAALQRGAKLFVNYCLSCHSAEFMRYNRMGEDLGLTDAQVAQNLMFAGTKVGQTMTVAFRPKDSKQWFDTAAPDLSVIARARGADWLFSYLNGFYVDPKRPFGVNNLFFKDVAMPHPLWELQGLQRAVTHQETNAKGKTHEVITHLELIGKDQMTPEAHTHQVAAYERQARDLVTFLVYVGEPAQLQRLALGWRVLLFLLVFFVFAYLLKREYWRDVH